MRSAKRLAVRLSLWGRQRPLRSASTRIHQLIFVAFALPFVLYLGYLGPALYPVTVADSRLHSTAGQTVGIEIVVARYNGQLDWLADVADLLNATVTVYCKNPNASATIYPCREVLSNVGNEGHTYLRHIVLHYDSLANLTVFVPDTAVLGDKLKTWRRFRRNLERAGPVAFYADDYTPITPLRYVANFLNSCFYGYNFPCKDTWRGGAECQYFGHSGGANPTGRLAPAEPADFNEWLPRHVAGASNLDIARCGWGNRGMFAASRAAVHKHSRGFYENLGQQLEPHAFPTAGMFVERLWRHIFLCSRGDGPAAKGALTGDAGALGGLRRR